MQFRRRGAGLARRVRQCRQCHAYAERLRRYGLRSRQHRRAMRKMLTRLRRSKNQRQAEVACAALVSAFGGLDRLLVHWITQAEADMKKGGLAAFRHLDAVLRLMRHCEDMSADLARAERERIRTMPDSELEAELKAWRVNANCS